MEKKKRPVAKCNICSRNSLSPETIGRKCLNVSGGKKCKGIFQRMLRDSDWMECGGCKATGMKKDGICASCGGDGWIGIRIG